MESRNVNIPDIKEFLHIEGGINDFLYYRCSENNLPNTGFPLRINGFSAGICLEGWMDISVGLHQFRLKRNDFIIILPCYIIQVNEVSKDFDFELIIVSNHFMDSININTEKIINPYVYMEEKPTVNIDDEEAYDLILTMYESIHSLSKFSNLPYYRQMIQHFVYAFLFGVGYIYEQFTPKSGNTDTANSSLRKRFFTSLQKNFKKEHSIKFYANELCLTPKYLSTYIRKTTGRTAKEWITDIIILEAKVLLLRNQMSIQQVADILNFPDQASFGKFFKKNTSVTPKDYKILA